MLHAIKILIANGSHASRPPFTKIHASKQAMNGHARPKAKTIQTGGIPAEYSRFANAARVAMVNIKQLTGKIHDSWTRGQSRKRPGRYDFLMLSLIFAAIEVVSLNVRYDNLSDGQNSWPHRSSTVQRYLVESNADFIGLQEVLPSQLSDLQLRLSSYNAISRTREADEKKGESTPLFYHRDRWRIDDAHQGTIWLSTQPNKPGSKSWDSSLPRICTWGRFERTGAGEPQAIWVMNTHFDHRGSTARLKSARLIRQKVEQRPKEMIHEPVIVLGDLNTPPGSPPILALGMADALRESTSGTWNGWDTTNRTGPRIDFILSRDLETLLGKVDFLTTKEERPASDHWPIRAVFRALRRPY